MSQAETLPHSPMLEQLFQLLGIADGYIDYSGQRVTIPHSNRLHVLQSMGIALHSDAAVAEALRQQLQRRYQDPIDRAEVVDADQGSPLALYLPQDQLDAEMHWRLETATGDPQLGRFYPRDLTRTARIEAADLALNRLQFVLPAVPAGYHTLHLSSGDRSWTSRIISAPGRCFEPPWLTGGVRLAGLSLQLYGLRSRENWGIGDLCDLKDLIQRSAQAGLDFIVLNPLHFLDSRTPDNCSPYSPLDRRYLNPLYIGLAEEPDFTGNAALQKYVAKPAFQERLAQLREDALVDYTSVTRLKLVVLGKMFKYFRKTQLDSGGLRGKLFKQWVKEHSSDLHAFAEFEAARHRLSLDQTRNADFHCYLQWLAESQLESCQVLAREQGMSLGLIRDLAVGGNAHSAEVRLNPGLFCLSARIGAPPDPLAPQGQNWGLPPLNPASLQRSGFQHFIDLLHSNMVHCGALRIDHVMSLMRLWWCPVGEPASAGAYVHYPVDALFAILRLESQRCGCVVIGEDLGVVPPEIRQRMTESGVISNVLFYFEKYDGVHYKHPSHFPTRAIAMVANHDVPTLAAWWNKSDLALRDRIGLFASPRQLQDAIRDRESDLIQVLHWLNGQGLLPQPWQDFNIHRAMDIALCQALLQANGHSASQLVSMQLDDLTLEERPVNIPGTYDEYPNWRRKLSRDLEQLFSASESRTMLDIFAQSRKPS